MWMSWRRRARYEYSVRGMELMAAWLLMLRLAALGSGSPAIAQDWDMAVDWGLGRGMQFCIENRYVAGKG